MNIDHILKTMNEQGVACLLIGGMNYLLRHEPALTYDVDFWIRNDDENLRKCEKALAGMQAQWGHDDNEWRDVSGMKPGWLGRQSVYCLTSPHGSIDIFLAVDGLGDWDASDRQAVSGRTQSGVAFKGLSDADMLRCQMALPESARKAGRINVLRKAMGLEQ